ncbi:MAG: TetR/AcrR family transcriptional regulator [Syntrophales bacterium]|nr:TetR/AcrR family transcriptional regulator [Syntrophales bacterium]
MGRKALYTRDQFVDAALKLLAEGGPGSVTIKAVAEETGAPVGSVYHRFLSRNILLAELWLRIIDLFQVEFLEALAQGDGLRAALYTPQWVRKHPKEGKVLLMYRQEDLASGTWPEDIRERALSLREELNEGIRSFVKHRFGRVTEQNFSRAVFALFDVPHGAVRRYMEVDTVPPKQVDDLVRETYDAVMGGDR